MENLIAFSYYAVLAMSFYLSTYCRIKNVKMKWTGDILFIAGILFYMFNVETISTANTTFNIVSQIIYLILINMVMLR